MTDTPPMSAEDRAEQVLAEAIYRYRHPGGGGYGYDPAGWPLGGAAHEARKHLEALSSEGLAVVAREELEAMQAESEAKAKTTAGEGYAFEEGRQHVIGELLRRLSGADQDG